MKSVRSVPSKNLLSPRKALYAAIATHVLLSTQVHAAPGLGEIVGGEGTIDQAGKQTTITQLSDRLSIDWDSFNIAADERVQFLQPSSSSLALNRVLGNDASHIFGRLDANGQVVLVNPNGVIFEQGSTINVGGLVASGLAVDPAEFMNGDFVFSAVEGTDGVVINSGLISAAAGGNVALLGKQVDNRGLISANLGSVALAAGNEAVVTFDQQGLIGVRVSKEILQEEIGLDAAVKNSGEINAEGGRVLLTASVSEDIFTKAVNAGDMDANTNVVMHDDGSFTLGGGADVVNTGSLNVSSETGKGQVVVLGENIEHSGSIKADGGSSAGNVELHALAATVIAGEGDISAASTEGAGGSVKVLGGRVGLLDQSSVNASGVDGGGSINIGGSYQGKELNIRNAERTVVGSEVSIKADALEQGDGGKVIVWADDTTVFKGNISVRGGEQSGDGGFVEVSGKQNLGFTGTVDRSAPNGKDGTLLLDPSILYIRRSDAALANDAALADSAILFDDPDTEFTISDTALIAALENGDVLLQADQDIIADGTDAPISVVVGEANASSLTLEAGRHIRLTNTELMLGSGGIYLTAGVAGWCVDCGTEILPEEGVVIEGSSLVTRGDIIVTSVASVFATDSAVGRDEVLPRLLMVFANDQIEMSLNSDLRLQEHIGLSITSSIQNSAEAGAYEGGLNYSIPELRTYEVVSPTELSYRVKLGSSSGDSPLNISAGHNISIGAYNTTGAAGVVDLADVTVTALPVPLRDFLWVYLDADRAVYAPQVGLDPTSEASAPVRLSAYGDGLLEFSRSINTGGEELEVYGSTSRWVAPESAAGTPMIATFGGSVTIGATFDQHVVQDLDLPSISTGGGNIEVVAGNINSLPGATIDVSSAAGHGDITLTATGSISVPGIVYSTPSTADPLTAPVISLTAGTDISLGDIDFNNLGTFAFDVSAPGSVSFLGSIADSAPGDGDQLALTVIADSNLDGFGDVTLGGSINTSGGNFSVEGASFLSTALDGAAPTLQTSGGDISLIVSQDAILPAISTLSGDFVVNANAVVGAEFSSIDTSSETWAGNIRFVAQESVDVPLIQYSVRGEATSPLRTSISIGARTDIRFGHDFDINNAGSGELTASAGGRLIFDGAVLDSAGMDGDFVNMFLTSGALGAAASAVPGAEFNSQISTGGGQLRLTVDNGSILSSTEAVIDTSSDDGISAGGLTLNASGDINLPAINLLYGNGLDGNNLIVETSAGNVLGSLPVRVGQVTTITAHEEGDVTLDSDGNVFLGVFSVTGNNVLVNSSGNLTFGGSTIFTRADFNANGNIDMSPLGNFLANEKDLSFDAAGGNINITGDFTDISVSNAGRASFRANGTLNIISAANVDTLTLNASEIRQGLRATGPIQTNIALALVLPDNGQAYLDHAANSFGQLSITGGSAYIRAADSFSLTAAMTGLRPTFDGRASGGYSLDLELAEGVLSSSEISSLQGDVILKAPEIQFDNGSIEVLGSASSLILSTAALSWNATTMTGDELSLVSITGDEGGNTFSFSGASSIGASVELYAGDGNDIISLGSVAPASVFGEGGNDTLQGADQLNSWTVDGEFSGSLNEATSFVGVEILAGGAEADTFTLAELATIGEIAGGAGNDVLTVAAGATLGSFLGGAGDDSATLSDAVVVTGTLDGGEGLLDSLDLSAVPGGGEFDYIAETPGGAGGNVISHINFENVLPQEGGSASFFGGDGATRWIFAEDGSFTIAKLNVAGEVERTDMFAGYSTVRAGAGRNEFILAPTGTAANLVINADATGDNTLRGSDLENVWSITGANTGSVQVVGAETQTLFENIGNLIGGDGTDSFAVMTGGSVTGSIAGGLGEDVLSVLDDALVNEWTLGVQNSVGAVASFAGIERALGNVADDVFTFSGVSDVVLVDGAAGVNTLGFGAGDVVVNLATGLANDTIGFANINQFNADLASANTLTGSDDDSAWTVTGEGAGRIAYGEQQASFLGFRAIIGGGGADTIDDATGVPFLDWAVEGVDTGTAFVRGEGGVNVLPVDPPDVIAFSGIESITLNDGGKVYLATPDALLSGGVVGQDTGGLADASGLSGEWSIDGPNTGTLRGTRFVNIVVLTGGEQDDRFEFLEGGSIGVANGYGGDDVFILSTSGSENGSALSGGAGTDIVVAPALANTWTVASGEGGNVHSLNQHQFSQVEGLVGGASTDDFFIVGENLTIESIDGGAGVNTLTGFDRANAWSLGAINTLNETLGFTNISEVRGGIEQDIFTITGDITVGVLGGAGVNTLQAADQVNAWLVTGDNAGSLNETVTFSEVTNLAGGIEADTFDVAELAIIGQIAGGAGSDILTVATGATLGSFLGDAGDDSATLAAGVTVTGTLDGGEGLADFLDIIALGGGDGEFDYTTGMVGGEGAAVSHINFEDVGGGDTGTSFFGGDGATRWVFAEDGSFTIEKLNAAGEVERTDMFSGYGTVRAGAGSNEFVLAATGTTADLVINADATGDNTLRGSDLDNVWSITGANTGSVQVAGAATRTLFENIGNLIGGDGADSFSVMTGGSVSGSITGGLGTDVLSVLDDALVNEWSLGVQNSVGAVASFAGIEQLIGNAGGDVFTFTGASAVVLVDGAAGANTLIGADQANTWLLGATNTLNDSLSFSNIGEVRGGTGQDLFTVTGDTTITIIGGAGENRLQGADQLNAWVTRGDAGGSLNETITFSGISRLLGGAEADTFSVSALGEDATLFDGGAGDDSLQGPDQANRWLVSGGNSGSFNSVAQFTGIENLLGGADADEFVVAVTADLTANIVGGAGENTLQGADRANAWLINGENSGSLNETITFSDVANVLGGAEADTFDVAELATMGTIAGGAGDDILTVASGATLVSFLGEAGDDSATLAAGVTVTGTLDGGEGLADFLDITALGGGEGEFDYTTGMAGGEGEGAAVSHINFEDVIGGPGAGTSFFGGDGATRWVFAEDGSFTIEKLSAAGEVERTDMFSGYSTVRAGIGSNEFILASTGTAANLVISADATGDNTLRGSDLENVWAITGANTGSVQVAGAATQTLFENIGNLIGGDRADSFSVMTGGSVTGSIAGGLGEDVLSVLDEALVNEWSLGAQNSVGAVASFTGIEQALGNAGDDVFTFSGVSDVVLVDGVAGANTLNFGAGDVVVNLATNLANDAIGFANINQFNADLTSASTLVGSDVDTSWVVTGEAVGTIGYGDSQHGFSGFSTLQGGNGTDTLSGSFNGDATFSITDANTGIFGAGLFRDLDLAEFVMDFQGIESVLFANNGQRWFFLETPEAALSGGVTADPMGGDAGISDYYSGVEGQWIINGNGSGSIRGTDFFGFSIATGGEQGDTFEVLEGGYMEQIFGEGGSDSFLLKNNNGEGMSISGGVGSDTLSAGDTENVWLVGNALSSALYHSSLNQHQFYGVEALVGGAVADDFTINDPELEIQSIDGGAGVNTLTGFDQANAWSLGATNTLNEALTFTNIGEVRGGIEQDIFTITGDTTVSILGGAGENILQGADQANTWLITGENAGSLNETVTFSQVTNLAGGIEVDTFNVAETAIIGQIAGGAGSDVLTVASGATLVSFLGDAGDDNAMLTAGATVTGTLDGGEGLLDSLDLGGLSSEGEFDYTTGMVAGGGEGVGVAVDHINFEDVIDGDGAGTSFFGGDGATRWVFAEDGSFTIEKLNAAGEVERTDMFSGYGTLRAGAGSNEFVLAPTGTAANLVINADATGDNTLRGSDLANVWAITGANTGSVQVAGAATQTLFENIGNLIGGDGANSFAVMTGGSVSGSIAGGLGADVLSVLDDALVTEWNLGVQNSVGAVASFTGIEQALGNAGDDVFTFSGVSDVVLVDGAAGVNTLGFAAGDVVINLATNLANGAIGFANINQFNTDLISASTLVGSDVDSTWTVTGEGAGRVAYGEQQASFLGFRSITGGAGADTITNDGATRLSWRVTGVDAGTTFLSEGDEAFALPVDPVDQVVFSGIETIAIGANTGIVFLAAPEALLSGGVVGQDTGALIDASGLAGEWLVEGPGTGTIRGTDFTNIQVIIGGDQSDRFEVAEAGSVWLALGQGGDDLFVLSAGTEVVSRINGGAGTDTLVPPDTANAWTLVLDEVSAYHFLNQDRFSAIEHLVGGASTDDFTVAGDLGEIQSIDGGAGINTLTGFDQANAWSLGATNTLNETLSFTNVSEVRGGIEQDAFTITGDTTVSIVGGEGVDSLQAADLANTWLVDGATSGSLNETVLFAEVDSLLGGAEADAFDVAAVATLAGISGGAGDDSFVIGQGAAVGTVDGGAGIDSLDAGDLETVQDFLGNITAGESTFDLINIENVMGSGLKFFGGDGANVWTINGDGTGTLTKLDGEFAGEYTFTNVTSLLGGEGEDEFVVAEGGSLAGVLDGGAANNRLTGNGLLNNWLINGINSGEASGAEGVALVFRNIAELVGSDTVADQFTLADGGSVASIAGGAGLGDSLVVDSDLSSVWSLDAAVNSLTRDGLASVNFNGVEALTGSRGDDAFSVIGATEVANIDAGLGANSLSFAELADAVTVNMQESSAGGIGFANITTFTGNAATSSRLVGADAVNTWSLAGNAGSIASDAGDLSFSGFNELQGGALADSFVLTDAVELALISGGAGANALTAADADNQWMLTDLGGSLNATQFADMQSLIGGAGQDSFILSTAAVQAANVDGGGGSDSLTGFDQVNSWTLASDATGAVTGLAAFANIENVQGGALGDTFTVAAGTVLETLAGGDGDDVVVTGADVSVVSLLGEGGNDEFQISRGLLASGTVDGGEGDGDVLDLRAYPTASATADLATLLGFTYANFESVLEPSLEGTLVGGNSTNIWYITGRDSGRLEVLDGAEAGLYEFGAVHTLVGGSGSDTFIFATPEAAISTAIDGGAGDNTITAQDLVNQWLISGINSGQFSNSANATGNVFTGIANLVGGAADDTFTLAAGGAVEGSIAGGAGVDTLVADIGQVNTWQLSGAGSEVATIASFAGIESLMGGEMADLFNLLDADHGVVQLDGLGGADSVTALYVEAVTLDLTDYQFANLATQSIEQFTASNPDSLVQGVEADVQWLLTGLNAGSAEFATAEGTAAVAFAGFGQLQGGSGVDQFVLTEEASLSMGLNGGAGTDLVRGANAATAWVIDGADAGSAGSTRFAAVENLEGGNAADSFAINAAGSISGRIDGGMGAARDSLSHSGDDNLWQLRVEDTSAAGEVAGNRFSGIESLQGAGTNDRVQGSDGINNWNLGDTEANTYVDLDGAAALRVAFTGMEQVLGGNGDDTFSLVSVTAVPEAIDGGAGSNSVNLQGLDADINLGLSATTALPAEGLNLRLFNIASLQGNLDRVNTLYGDSDQGYTWTIDGERSGRVAATLADDTSAAFSFADISAIVGGEQDDIFQVNTQQNAIFLDGGAAVTADFVDYSLVEGDISVNLTQTFGAGNGALRGIEGVRGNNAGGASVNVAELVGSGADNLWLIGAAESGTLADGVNDGTVSDGNQTVTFIDFSQLSGGAGNDTFDFADGVIEGQVTGGAGDDLFQVSVDGPSSGSVFDGGAGDDLLRLTGGEGYEKAVYTPSVAGGELLLSAADAEFRASYVGMETISEQSLAQDLEINGTEGIDTITLGVGRFSVNDGGNVQFSNKTNLRIAAGSTDFVELLDAVTLPGSFTLVNGSLIARGLDSSITASELLLEGTGNVGSAAARLRTSIDTLRLRNAVGDVYLQEADGLDIAEFTTSGEFDLLLMAGNLTSSAGLTSSDDLRIDARAGDILLTASNGLTGRIGLSASGLVDFSNNASSEFSAINAEELRLKTSRNINAEGEVVVAGNTLIDAGGTVAFTNAGNDFNRVTVTAAQDVSITDQNALELAGVDARGRVLSSAESIVVSGAITADSIDLAANSGTAELNAALDTQGGGGIRVSGNAIVQEAPITSGTSLQLISGTSITQNSSITAGGIFDAVAENGDIAVKDGVTTRGSIVTIAASQGLRLQDIDAGAINISGGTLVVTNGSLRASDGDITVSSGKYSMTVDSLLEAYNGSISISATDGVDTNSPIIGGSVDIDGADVNLGGDVTATDGSVTVTADTTINVIRTVTAEGDVGLSTGDGTISQSGAVTANGGNVAVNAGGSGGVVMEGNSSTTAGAGSVSIGAGGDVVVGTVNSRDTVTIDAARGTISDGNGSGSNITSGGLTAKAGQGIGAGDALETAVGSVDVSTTNGDIALGNSGDLTVGKIATGRGNVDLINSGDITLNGNSVGAGYDDEGGGDVSITSVTGDIKQQGPRTEPAVSGMTLLLRALNGSVGAGDLFVNTAYISVRAQTSGGRISSARPDAVLSEIIFGSTAVKDQLVVIEPLEDLNPAIFSDVKSYFHNDISLRMPQDQLYEEEEELSSQY